MTFRQEGNTQHIFKDKAILLHEQFRYTFKFKWICKYLGYDLQVSFDRNRIFSIKDDTKYI